MGYPDDDLATAFAGLVMTLETLNRAIAALEKEIQYGMDHPYAGYCGEDDAREDKLESLKLERKLHLESEAKA